MSNRNYRSRREFDGLTEWADGHETHEAVAVAIHAIADSNRTAETIWAEPTAAEWDHVTMAVEEYVTHGDFERQDDGRYMWGLEAVEIPA